MITYNNTTSSVEAYQPTLGLQNLGATSSSPTTQSASEDTVKLSTTAQVSALHTNGMNVKQIAASMGITTQEVDQYLGITTTSSAPAGGGGGGGAPPPATQSKSATSSSSTTSSTATTTKTKKA